MTQPLPFLPLPHCQRDPDPRGFHSLLLWAGAGPGSTQCPPTSWFLISPTPSTQLPTPTRPATRAKVIPSGSWKNRNPEAARKDLEHGNLQRSSLWLSRVCRSPGNRNNRNVGSSLMSLQPRTPRECGHQDRSPLGGIWREAL